MLQQIADGLWTLPVDHAFLGLQIGTRMNVVRLPDGSLLVHSPVRLAAPLQAEIDALGPVRHLVAPNLYHHVYVGDWAAAYPDAVLHAPAALRRKRPELRIDADLGAGPPREDWAGALVAVPVEGTLLGETVLVHPASRTLLSADLTENFETSSHWPTRQYLWMSGIHGRVGLARPLRLLFRDRAKARRSIDALLEHDFDRVVVAHGRVIEAGGREAVRQTYEGWLR